jgi:hypothetical protein
LYSIKPNPEFNESNLHYFIYQVYGVPLVTLSKDLIQLVTTALRNIPAQEQEAISLRFSLYDQEINGIKTLESVSVMVNPPVCKQTIYLRIQHGIRRLRTHAYSSNIRVCLKYLQERNISQEIERG